MRRQSIRVSRLEDSDIERIKTILEELSIKAAGAPGWRIVQVQRQNTAYWRRAPGAARLEEKLGTKAFDLFGTLLSLGLDAWQDSKRAELTPSQRIGRASLDLLIDLSPLELLVFATSVVAPEQTDYAKSWLFSAKSPHINFIADQIVRIGGKSFQEWSAKPNWLDFI